MASSQVEVAAASPFGCVLRDHNSRRDRRREVNGSSNQSPKAQTNSFQRNFKDLVRDHLQSCISLSPRASSNHETDENLDQQCGGFSCFGGGAGGCSSKTTTVAATSNQKNSGGTAKKENKDVSNKHQGQSQGKAKDKAQVKAQSQNQNRTSFITGSAKKEIRDLSPAKSESSGSDLSVSSLVQKWRGFEAHRSAGPPTPTPISTATSLDTSVSAPVLGEMSRANSGASTIESTLTTADESGEREEISSVGERETRTITKEEEMEEKERERREREKERIRVADIVRKWPGDESRVCLARLKIRRDNKGKDNAEGKTFSPCLFSSPRIRGRRAIVDMFMRMERERYEEVEVIGSKYAVTKFTHRGRIQAFLRLRLLRRDQTIEEQKRPQRPPLPSKVVGSSRGYTGSSITSLKEKFKSSADKESVHQSTTSKESPSSSQPGAQIASTSSKHVPENASRQHEQNDKKFLAKKEQETENTSTSSKQSIDDQSMRSLDKKSVSTISNESPKQVVTEEKLTIPSHSYNNEDAVTSNKNSEPQLDSHCEESNEVLEVPQNDDPSSEAMLQENGYEEDANVDMETQDVEEPEASYNGYWGQGEGEDCYKDPEASQYYFEPNLDWISDIARPRSYWEDLRQAWYQEVFNTRSQNEEIRQLLERGSVKNVLASDFREKMDHLLTNSAQRANSSLEEPEEDVEDSRQENRRQLLERGCVSAVLASDFAERMDQLVMNRVQAMPSSVVEEQSEDITTALVQIVDDGQEDDEEEVRQEDSEEEHGQEDNEEEEDEEEDGEIVDEREHESSFMHQYQNVNDFYGQNSTPSQSHWDEHDDESNYYSDNAESVSLQEPSPLTSYDRGTHEDSSSFKNPSIEMELIYDLRSHMEQLYREMAELRKSVTSCMDMQIKMQHTIREEVSTAIMHQGSSSKITKQVEKKGSNRRKPQRKGTCCICHEKKVDCLLYRCGHMCTCFTCANELQWGSGKCPICRAQIMDVVRAFPDS